jgi:SAM-dependent MidA family methyltransferase
MDLALYDPRFGYYARAAQRSGRAGDFFTSVDVGPLFGQLLAAQVAEMATLVSTGARVDLVEAGAGNGRLSADILRALHRDAPGVYDRLRLLLVEASPEARLAQAATFGSLAERLDESAARLPASFEGILVANELFDAMPAHQVVMRAGGLREVYVEASGDHLATREGPLSTVRLQHYFDDLGIALEPGWRAEVSLAAYDWMREAAAALTRGFAIFIDYGHEANELYSVTHSSGTLTSYRRHQARGAESPSPAESWLRTPGEQDLTAHVDFTTLRRAAEQEGCVTLAYLDQMYFLMALATPRLEALTPKERLALKTLIMPGGLGSTMKVLILGKNMPPVSLIGYSGRARIT